MRRLQSIRGGVWYMGGRKKRRRPKGRIFPSEALASPILGTLGGVVVKKLFRGQRLRRRRRYV